MAHPLLTRLHWPNVAFCLVLAGLLLVQVFTPTLSGWAKGTLKEGDRAPSFSLVGSDGKITTSESLKGHPYVLVFYPGDNTPGCTIQLCRLRDGYAQFQQKQTAIFGVNHADKQSHEGFARKQKLPFPLLVDSKRQLAKAYGVGSTLGFVHRTVFVIDGQGIVRFAQDGMPSNETLLDAIAKMK